MARLTRHELKKDEFATRFETLSEFFLVHRRNLIVWGGSAALALAIALGASAYVRSQQIKAESAFGNALATYHALVTDTPPGPQVLTFKTSEEKHKAALQQFQDAAKNFGRWQAGRRARYYAALCQRELGQPQEAEKELTAITKESDEDLAALAKMALAGIYAKTARASDAEKIYKDLQAHPTATVPKPTVEIALAEFYQQTDPQKATPLYQQIAKEYPGTSAGDLASKMLASAAE